MNRHDVHLLQQLTGYPSVTITLPTHRIAPQNQQDALRVKNLVTQATERLLTEFGKRDINVLVARLTQLAGEIDHNKNLDGLAIFANQDFARALQLPFPLKERVVIDETFFTRDLVFALNRTPRYWVLALSEKPTRLFEGTRESLVEISEGGFPMTHGGPGGAQQLPGGIAVNKSAYRDEYHRKFFRDIDSALKPFMDDDPLPLVLVGVDRFLAFFQEVTGYGGAILTALQGSHDKTSAHELGRLVWPLVKARLQEKRQEFLVDLEKAMGERKVASTIGEAWRMAKEGRGRLLLVEEGYHAPAVVDENGRHLTLVDDATVPGVIDDAVDDLIESVMRKQGQVQFVEDGQLSEHGRIALILRY